MSVIYWYGFQGPNIVVKIKKSLKKY